MSDRNDLNVIHLHPLDNICVAIRNLAGGTDIEVGNRTVVLSQPVRLGHKIAIEGIAKGAPVRKYGQTIGFATEAIAPGNWVHVHNLSIGAYEKDYAIGSETPPPPAAITGRTFQGYRRANGTVGTRNYIGVISSVNCSASVCKQIARRFTPDQLEGYANVDGVVALAHHAGCGMQYGGQAHQMLNRVLGGMARHPNIGAYLLVGLGCEQGAISNLIQDQGLVQLSRPGASSGGPIVLTMQELGGTAKTIEAGVRKIAEMLPRVDDAKRVPIPASEIVLGTNCGGSDGNSGITANPALGVASDMIVACGGTSILTETPEIFGAEHLLTRRARSREVAEKLIERIRWWQWYAGLFGVELDNNPSVGNKEGGLTTIAEKSLGAVAKGGSTALMDVIQYAEPVRTRGLVVMDSPGYDPPSVTGLLAAGANVVVFTTGRGSCFACKPVPTIKVATNTAMFEHMIDDMDINAGGILEGRSVEEVGRQIFEEILAVASGNKTKSEQLGLGDEEFMPWIVGPTL
jgi:altronate hydrolase